MNIFLFILMAVYGTGFVFTLGYCLGDEDDSGFGLRLAVALIGAVGWPIAWFCVACMVMKERRARNEHGDE